MKKDKILIFATIFICLFTISMCIYLIYKTQNNEKNMSNNEIKQNDNDKINNEKSEETTNKTEEDYILSFPQFDSSKYSLFEKQMLNALYNSTIFNDNFYKKWNLDDIEYINLTNITYYGKIADEYLYKLDFAYKCKTTNDTCVFLNEMTDSTNLSKIEKSIFVFIKNKQISNIETSSGGFFNPVIEEYYNKINPNELFYYNNETIEKIEELTTLRPYCKYKFYKITTEKENYIMVVAPDENNNPIVIDLENSINENVF